MFAYEKLDVYQKAFEVNQYIYNLLKKSTSISLYMKNQLGRATLSIMLNIAEGSGKLTERDRKNFFVIARASAFESASICKLLHAESEIALTESQFLYSSFERISVMLWSMIKQLS